MTALLVLAASACSSGGGGAGGAEGETSGSSSAKDSSSSTTTTTTTPPPPPPELPRGGREVFPRYRLFGYSGQPGAPGQGRLGIGDLDERMAEIEKRGRSWAFGREIMPTMELISTVVHSSPGDDGMYRSHIPDEQIKEWLATATKHKAMLLLNIQPGRADFLAEVKYYAKYLKEPNVGLALDPEWAVGPGERPGRVYGSTTGAELDTVSAYVAALIKAHDLPEKVIVVHQLHAGIVQNQAAMKDRPGVVWVKSVDGIGSAGAKTDTWKAVTKNQPKLLHGGFKLFYQEDAQHGPLMTPKQVMALRPLPEYVLFE